MRGTATRQSVDHLYEIDEGSERARPHSIFGVRKTPMSDPRRACLSAAGADDALGVARVAVAEDANQSHGPMLYALGPRRALDVITPYLSALIENVCFAASNRASRRCICKHCPTLASLYRACSCETGVQDKGCGS